MSSDSEPAVDIFAEDEWDEYTYENHGVTQRYLGSWRNFDGGWPGTTYMTSFLLTEGASAIKGKRVMELGAGNALPSLLAAQAGAVEVVATDGDATEVSMVAKSAEKFGCGETRVQSRLLNWGTEGATNSTLSSQRREFDVILACETAYELAAIPLLLESVQYFLAEDGVAFILNTCAQTSGTADMQGTLRTKMEDELTARDFCWDLVPLEPYHVPTQTHDSTDYLMRVRRNTA